MIKCHRVWFKDGRACLIDATGPAQARALAEALHKGSKVTKVECLDNEEVKGDRPGAF